ncbi:uncharacterized protein LOC103506483 [Diaphorina citri]|uniref:Uncharacterized protein LOC103506483 n=1 Tax=Diaphorina citri TaxID=121845 RepID=A0A1S4E877_DIACI|nr:uncharacterized protein LOC103506483 [Diaphorina citri]
MTSINNTYDHEEKMKTLHYLESKLQDHGNLELPILNRDTDTDNRIDTSTDKDEVKKDAAKLIQSHPIHWKKRSLKPEIFNEVVKNNHVKKFKVEEADLKPTKLDGSTQLIKNTMNQPDTKFPTAPLDDGLYLKIICEATEEMNWLVQSVPTNQASTSVCSNSLSAKPRHEK